MSGTVDVLGYAPNSVFSISFSREAIFRSIMQLLDSGDIPQVFIAISYAQATAIHEVAYFRNLELERDLFLFCLGEDDWYNSMFVNLIVCTFRDAQKLDISAAEVFGARIEVRPSIEGNREQAHRPIPIPLGSGEHR